MVGRRKPQNCLGCLTVCCKIKVCLNGSAPNLSPLPRLSILQSIIHLCSSSIVIQTISTQRTDSESKEAEKERYKEIEPYFLGFLGKEARPLCSSLSPAALCLMGRRWTLWREGYARWPLPDAQLCVSLSWGRKLACQACEKQDIQTVWLLPLFFMPTLFQKTVRF